MIGRPTDYTPELAALICEQLASGLSLKKVCEPEHMPCMRAVFLWLTKHEEFVQLYARAREQQAECLFEEIFEISDETHLDHYEDEDGKKRVDHEAIARSKLRVDTRRWALSKLLPKKYGEHLSQDIDLKTTDASMSDEQRASRIAAIFKRAAARRKALKVEDVSDLV